MANEDANVINTLKEHHSPYLTFLQQPAKRLPAGQLT